MLKKGRDLYDNSSKKSAQIFKGICKIDFWNKRLNYIEDKIFFSQFEFTNILYSKKKKKWLCHFFSL